MSKTKTIEHDGKQYIDANQLICSFNYVIDEHNISYSRKKGMPCLKVGNKWWYNKDDCSKWYTNIMECKMDEKEGKAYKWALINRILNMVRIAAGAPVVPSGNNPYITGK